MSELETCPFCGSDRVHSIRAEDGTFRVECWVCGASVESIVCMARAIRWWNRRTIDRDELLKVADECEEADVDGVSDWAERIRKAVGE